MVGQPVATVDAALPSPACMSDSCCGVGSGMPLSLEDETLVIVEDVMDGEDDEDAIAPLRAFLVDPRRPNKSCEGEPTRVKSLRHQGRAPRPWRAFRDRRFRDHEVASCWDPLKCFCCRCSGHLSKHCPARHSVDYRRRAKVNSDQQADRRSVHEWLSLVESSPLGGSHVSPSGEMLQVDSGVTVAGRHRRRWHQ